MFGVEPFTIWIGRYNALVLLIGQYYAVDEDITQGNYHIEREASEPDPHIIDLNGELGKCEGFLANAVPERERRYVPFTFLSEAYMY